MVFFPNRYFENSSLISGPDKTETYFFDAFRHFHLEKKEAFTCWNVSANCRSTNFGTRIDYILTSNDLKNHLVTCDIHPDIQVINDIVLQLGPMKTALLLNKYY